jgi:hypothetical protein
MYVTYKGILAINLVAKRFSYGMEVSHDCFISVLFSSHIIITTIYVTLYNLPADKDLLNIYLIMVLRTVNICS